MRSRDSALSAAAPHAAVGNFAAVRRATEALAAPLSPEDQAIQSMPDVSPTKWHRAHTTWFFETFLLVPHSPGYAPFHPAFGYLFNSYYEAAGPRHPRPQRGLLSRPGCAEIAAYRRHVDAAMTRLLEQGDPALASLVELGLHHEQQHQELILMDVKHVFSMNPLKPAYHAPGPRERRATPPLSWMGFEGGLVEIGHDGASFAFDNEGPRHKTWLEPFRLASRPVTCGEYLAFIEDGGYRQPGLWLSDGWGFVQAEGISAPLYWERGASGWDVFTLSGPQVLDPAEPVCHLSYYEADAFARWAGKRLPREAEWEVAARGADPGQGNFAGARLYHPRPAASDPGLQQLFGDVWEWTQSPYAPYPGFRAAEGAIGEYNGKFMSSQMVLRGGAALTPEGHVRATYRNFFPPGARWAMSGLRLAEDA